MVRVRFAPSPTGFLHQGNIRTALYNFLFAKQSGGKGILRIDDTDAERSKEEYITALQQDLKWLGLDFEEGPYRQSERKDFYQKYLDQLIKSGHVYPCFATAEDIEAERRKALATGKTFVFRSPDRDLSPDERQARIESGEKPHYRFAVQREILKFQDIVYGEKVFDTINIGDFTVARSDGTPLYLFASAVDDGLLEITHIIRGEDGLSNTPRQILLQRALGFSLPQFAHLPLILGPDHTLLSKRNGSSSVSELKDKGYLPEAILNYLSLLGWAPPEGKEVLSLEELIQEFRLQKVSRSSAIFDWDKFNFINYQFLRKLSDADYLVQAKPFVEQCKLKDIAPATLEQTALALRPNIRVLTELPEWLELVLGHPVAKTDEAKSFLKESSKVFQAALEFLTAQNGEFSEETASAFFDQVKKQSKQKGKKLFMPIRVALTGATHGPELVQLLVCLGKQRVKERIASALKNIQHQESS